MPIEAARFVVMSEGTIREQRVGYPAKCVAAAESVLKANPPTIQDFMFSLIVVVRNHLGDAKDKHNNFGIILGDDHLVKTPLCGRTYFEAFEAAYNARNAEPLSVAKYLSGDFIHTWAPVYVNPNTGPTLPLTIITNNPAKIHKQDSPLVGLQQKVLELDRPPEHLRSAPRILHPNYIATPGFYEATEDAYRCLMDSRSRNDREAVYDFLMPLIGHSIGLVARGGTSATLIARETLAILGKLDEPPMMRKGTDYWAHVMVRTVEESVADHQNWYDRKLDPREVMEWHMSHAERNRVEKERLEELDYIRLAGIDIPDGEAAKLRAAWKARAEATTDPDALDHISRLQVHLAIHNPIRKDVDLAHLAELVAKMRDAKREKE